MIRDYVTSKHAGRPACLPENVGRELKEDRFFAASIVFLNRESDMHRRTLSLLATPAVLGAMTVAVPALAGTISGGGSHKATARQASTGGHCFSAVVGGRHVRECLITGPRGTRGPRGFLGPNGPRGIQGKTGREGAAGLQGVPGTARAYALVLPESVGASSSSAGLVPAQSTGFTAIRSSATGIYCLTPVGSINPATEAPVASGEAGYSGSEVLVPVAVVYAKQPTKDCGPNEFEVKTYKLESGAPTLSKEVAFTIVVP